MEKEKLGYIITLETTIKCYEKRVEDKDGEKLQRLEPNGIKVKNITIINNTVYASREEAREVLRDIFIEEVPLFVDENKKLRARESDNVWMVAGAPKETDKGVRSKDSIYRILEVALSPTLT